MRLAGQEAADYGEPDRLAWRGWADELLFCVFGVGFWLLAAGFSAVVFVKAVCDLGGPGHYGWRAWLMVVAMPFSFMGGLVLAQLPIAVTRAEYRRRVRIAKRLIARKGIVRCG